MTPPVRVDRSPVRLEPDAGRVICLPFHPGQEALIEGLSRAEAVVERVLAMSDAEVSSALDEVLVAFADRHDDLRATFREHAAFVSHRLTTDDGQPALTDDRVDLIGACLTQEYAVESAALFNPSIVAHPDQRGCAAGELRILMSVRAVGEGHLSSVEFRTGMVGPGSTVRVDPPAGPLTTGRVTHPPMPVAFLRAALAQSGDAVVSEGILRLLPATFTPDELDGLLASSALDGGSPARGDGLLDRIRRVASASYRLTFSTAGDVSSRVIIAHSAAEAHGVEDLRLITFVDDDGESSYVGTYTAFDGQHVAPHVLRTRDFVTFDAAPMIGPAAQNKGMAIFPRRIAGDVWALSRWDRESLSVARSADGVEWGLPQVVLRPRRPWDLIQLGACSSPVETDDGWLVLIHGVGPMRVYSIGAMLLDLDDPTRVIGVLDEPVLTPLPEEREGYVPNVVYSCGVLVHGSTLVVPYGCSDASIRFAFVDLPELLARLRTSRA